jgi:hypothetical protein
MGDTRGQVFSDNDLLRIVVFVTFPSYMLKVANFGGEGAVEKGLRGSDAFDFNLKSQ